MRKEWSDSLLLLLLDLFPAESANIKSRKLARLIAFVPTRTHTRTWQRRAQTSRIPTLCQESLLGLHGHEKNTFPLPIDAFLVCPDNINGGMV